MLHDKLFNPPSLFPDPSLYEDVVALSKKISQPLLIEGYAKGFFPWPHDEMDEIPWFHPVKRAVLFLNDIRINRSLERTLRGKKWRFEIDKNFNGVIEACAKEKRPGQKGTWINKEILAEYKKLHRAGFAHSVEAYNEAGDLVGGIYGVQSEVNLESSPLNFSNVSNERSNRDGLIKKHSGFFSAESMFFKESGASKACLLFLCEELKKRGEILLDIQMLTPHMVSIGAVEIPREKFLEMLGEKIYTD